MIVGLDIGFGYTKMVFSNGYNEHKLIFPSTVSNYIPKESFGETPETVIVNGQEFIVGDRPSMGNRINVDNFLGSDEYLAFCAFCLSKIDGHKKVLVLGVPPEAYDKGITEQTIQKVKSMDAKTSDGRRIYPPPKIEFVPQGVGIYFSYIMEVNGEDVEKTTVVMDVGYHTTDMVLFVDGKYKPTMARSFPIGVGTLYDSIRSQYVAKYQVYLPDNCDDIIEGFLTEGKITHYDTTHTLDVEPLLKNYIKKLQGALSKYSSLTRENNYRIEKIVVGGGGVTFLKNISGAHVVEDAQFANAFGYYRFGQRQAENV